MSSKTKIDDTLEGPFMPPIGDPETEAFLSKFEQMFEIVEPELDIPPLGDLTTKFYLDTKNDVIWLSRHFKNGAHQVIDVFTDKRAEKWGKLIDFYREHLSLDQYSRLQGYISDASPS